MSLPAITSSGWFQTGAPHPAHFPEPRTLNPEPSPEPRTLNPEPSPEPFPAAKSQELKDAFTDFVGQTFFGQLIAQMRQTVDKPAYFHGGRAEEIFQGQLDQRLAQELADASSEQFAEPMFDLFSIQRAA